MLLLTSCSSSTKPLEIKTNAAKIERQIYARPSGVKSPDISVVLVTPERANRWNKEIIEGKRPPYVFFAYDENDYLTFSQWLQNILSYINSQNALIEAYENDVESHNGK